MSLSRRLGRRLIMKRQISIVMGANWGDEGKGSVTAKLADREGAIVVLCNGGPQRGHASSNGKVSHTFHHFGSGTLNRKPTVLAREFMVNPMAFVEEWNELKEKGFEPSVYGENPLVTFPHDMLFNQHLERLRGGERHGSCGMGIWATQCRANENFGLRLEDFRHIEKSEFDRIWRKLIDFYKDKLDFSSMKFLEDPNFKDHYWQDLQHTLKCVPLVDKFGIFDVSKDIVFEMGQGLELDMNRKDNMPHISGSDVGVDVPLRFLERNELKGKAEVTSYFVTRPYVTRHGAGPLKYECAKEDLFYADDLTNVPNEWQGPQRYARIDVNRLIRNIHMEKRAEVKRALVITHVDETFGQVLYVEDGKDVDRNMNVFAENMRHHVDGVFASDSDSSLDPLRSVWT